MTDTSSRQAIMDTARDLIIRNGYRGTSFGDIAKGLSMTRANIHYHFGTKPELVEAVLSQYIDATLSALGVIWLNHDLPLRGRVEQMLKFSLGRYRRYNKAHAATGQWSLISRLRQDADQLTARSRDMLSSFSANLQTLIGDSIAADVRAKLFAADLPTASVAAHIALIADNASAIAIDAEGVRHLSDLYRSFVSVVEHGYGPT